MSRRALGLLAATAIAVGFGAGVGTDRALRSASGSRAPTVRAELGPAFSVTPGISGLAFDRGRLWIRTEGGALWGNEGQIDYYRLDPAEPGGLPPHLAGPLRPAAARSVRFRTEPVGQAFGGANTFARSGATVWAGFVGSSSKSEISIVKELDLRTGRTIGASVSVPGVPDEMAIGSGYVWLFTHDENELGVRLWQIDPRRHAVRGHSLRIAAAVSAGNAPVIVARRRLWFASEDSLFEIDLVA